jgi:hypothetical protein
MTTYTASIGEDNIEFLTQRGSAIACADLLDHVAAAEDQSDADTIVFDNAVAQVLRSLSVDEDGCMSDGGPGVGEQIWIGGLGYSVQVAVA